MDESLMKRTMDLPKLPDEIWTRVINLMHPQALLHAAQVCRKWRDWAYACGGEVYRDCLLRDKAQPVKQRLAYPKKVFKRIERDYAKRRDTESGAAERLRAYRLLTLVCVMRTCPLCQKQRDMCIYCGQSLCEPCEYSEALNTRQVRRVNDFFTLPMLKCTKCTHGRHIGREEMAQRNRRRNLNRKQRRYTRFMLLHDDPYDELGYDAQDGSDEWDDGLELPEGFWECYDPKD